MGQVIYSLGYSNCLLGQLYCKKSVSIADITDHFNSSSNRSYYKPSNFEEIEAITEWPSIAILTPLFGLYHDPRWLVSWLPHNSEIDKAPKDSSIKLFLDELERTNFSPIITIASLQTNEQKVIWDKYKNQDDGDGWEEHDYDILCSIPICFGHGWRSKINLIPRVCGWRPDEHWLSDKFGNRFK
jgi:hypothetical protein